MFSLVDLAFAGLAASLGWHVFIWLVTPDAKEKQRLADMCFSRIVR